MSRRSLIALCAVLVLGSCVDPEKAAAPVTAPIHAREHIRQEVRKINHQAQLRDQQLQQIEQR